ncbi:MAG: ABC transporter permease subunit [Myxococcota bacterium]|nr:ABC transporter permease subunit [Myxococcota bacterium]
MLPLAAQFELRSIVRDRVGTAALLAFLSIGTIALFLGERHVEGWRQAVRNAGEAQQESIDEARSYLASGQGPADRPWVDLAQPRWQDHYAGTRIHREPGPLAGIAAGSVDSAPVAFRVNSRADPSAGGGYRIENPELAMGSVDLTFVLSILSPLLIGVLGVGIGGREREERIDRLIVVQSGDLKGWLMARLVVVTAIAAIGNAVLCAAAGWLGDAGAAETLTLVAVGVGYAALWGGLLAAISASARSVRAEALGYGAVWLALCIVVPTVAAEVSLARVQSDFGVAETLDARALNYEAYEMAIDDVTTQLYARYPELAELPAAKEAALAPGPRRTATGAILVAAMAERVGARQEESRTAQRFAERAAWASPAVALTVASERLAGVGPEAAAAFQAHSMAAVEARVGWILRSVWRMEPLGPTDFEALIERTPAPFRWDPGVGGSPARAMLLWFVVPWALAVRGFHRSERRMVRSAPAARPVHRDG